VGVQVKVLVLLAAQVAGVQVALVVVLELLEL
jgi:hypothetical protein